MNNTHTPECGPRCRRDHRFADAVRKDRVNFRAIYRYADGTDWEGVFVNVTRSLEVALALVAEHGPIVSWDGIVSTRPLASFIELSDIELGSTVVDATYADGSPAFYLGPVK